MADQHDDIWRCRCGHQSRVNGCTPARCATPGHRLMVPIRETIAPGMTVQIEITRNNAREGLGTFGLYAEMGGQSIGFSMSRETARAIVSAFGELGAITDDEMDDRWRWHGR